MRVLFYGNQGNHGYRFVKWLRARNIEADLFMQKNFNSHRSQPEWEDPDLNGDYPSWIQTFSRKPIHELGFPESEIIKISKKYDVVMTAGQYVLNGMALKKPIVFFSVGGDLTQTPFKASSLRTELRSYIYRRRIKNVDRILTPQEDCFWASKLLGVYDKVIPFILPSDVDGIATKVDSALLGELEKKYGHYDWVFFNPSRKNLDATSVDYKGSDKLVLAFQQFLESEPSLKIKLVFGMHGRHVLEFRELVERLNLTKYCDFVGPLMLPKLYAYMSLKNVVVFDQFGVIGKALGGVTREALSLGAMVSSSTDVDASEFLKLHGPGCPVFPAFEVEDIMGILHRVIRFSPEEQQASREAAKVWTRKYLHWENRIDELIEILEEVAQKNGKVQHA